MHDTFDGTKTSFDGTEDVPEVALLKCIHEALKRI
jgi:hypothetical protein